jgi:hypothetical protein
VTERPDLHVVDTATGEIVETCEHCADLADQLAGAEREIRAWRTRCANLERESDKDARNHPFWKDAERLVAEWRKRCRHPRSQLTADRFWMLQPFLHRHGYDLCLKAVAGAAFDPMTKERKNGSVQRFDALELIFRSEGHFESFVNRAPRE